jgi:hypothetical protein
MQVVLARVACVNDAFSILFNPFSAFSNPFSAFSPHFVCAFCQVRVELLQPEEEQSSIIQSHSY